MSVYELEKRKLSEIQSNYHKLLNSFKQINSFDTLEETKKNNILESIMDINSVSDILISKIIYLNEYLFTHQEPTENKHNLHIIKSFQNDDKAINDLIPLLLMYRMMLNP